MVEGGVSFCSNVVLFLTGFFFGCSEELFEVLVIYEVLLGGVGGC